jgi:O-antigen/teichoic acid export membrane protein
MTTGKSLKEKTISGMIWSFSDSMSTQLVQFIVGLILARILSPSEFGLIGMITVFLAVSQSLVDSGIGQALIRKKDADNTDYSTAFYFNFVAGLLIFLIFYLSAPYIASFYNQPGLTDISRVLGVIILINATVITQRTRLIRSVNFRLLMKVNLVSAIISGILATGMALKGYGVWSLVGRSVAGSVVQAVLLWHNARWHPEMKFSRASFRSLFSFGSRLLVSGLIDTVYRNIYLLIIGKFFSAAELGYYTRADQFSRLASQNLTGTIQRVSYPVLSIVQDEDEKLKAGYRKLIMSTMYVTFLIMLGMAAMARPMILTLIGAKWLPSVEFLQLLCLSSMLFPLHSLNLNILNVKGRSDLFLRLEIIKKLLAVPVIVAGIAMGIRAMLIGLIILSVVSYFINSYFSGRLIHYSVKDQISDIMPSFLLALVLSVLIYSITFISGIPPLLLLIIQASIFLTLAVIISKALKMKGYFEIRNILTDKIPKLKKIL